MVDLAHVVMLCDRAGGRLVELVAMDHADADVGLADVDVAHLLVEELLGDRLLRVSIEFRCRDVGARAHEAGGLRVGGIHLLGKRGEGGEGCGEGEGDRLHGGSSPGIVAGPF